MTPSKALYIAIEGNSGSGKTRQVGFLGRRLTGEGLQVTFAGEPHLSAVKHLIHRPDVRLDPEIEALIFAADRIIQQKTLILPALARNRIVISDRSVYASLAYQVVRGLSEEFVKYINRSVRYPDRVLLLDIEPTEGLKRIKLIGRTFSHFEKMDLMKQVRERYLRLARREKRKFAIIDAAQPERLVHEAIWKAVERWISR